MAYPVIIIVGPTASGKTGLAIDVAEHLSGEIVSADSRQIYRYMDIGTAKPSPEELARIPHHCIDIRDPDEYFSAGEYSRLARGTIDSLHHYGTAAVVAGGSGLYIKALVEGMFSGGGGDRDLRRQLKEEAERKGLSVLYERFRRIDPAGAAKIHPNDKRRIVRALEVFAVSGQPISKLQREKTVPAGFTPLYFGLDWPRDLLYRRIEERAESMMDAGLVREVETLLDMGFHPALNSMNSVGYKEIISYLRGEVSRAGALDLIKRNTRRYAKRQLTWLRSVGAVTWLPCAPESGSEQHVSRIVREYRAARSAHIHRPGPVKR
ncbi:tRNA (adenosine(37)-N6)-dimethylallyltransferase MiaA [bacterium]|nr:tRNA (adenosine(37)-N6)-dimethylallyltransferase MiaA [bacterium]